MAIESGVASFSGGSTFSAVSNVVEGRMVSIAKASPVFLSGALSAARFVIAGDSTAGFAARKIVRMLMKAKSRTIMRIRSKPWEW